MVGRGAEAGSCRCEGRVTREGRLSKDLMGGEKLHTGKNVPDRGECPTGPRGPCRRKRTMAGVARGSGRASWDITRTWASVLREAGSQVLGKFGAGKCHSLAQLLKGHSGCCTDNTGRVGTGRPLRERDTAMAGSMRAHMACTDMAPVRTVGRAAGSGVPVHVSQRHCLRDEKDRESHNSRGVKNDSEVQSAWSPVILKGGLPNVPRRESLTRARTLTMI